MKKTIRGSIFVAPKAGNSPKGRKTGVCAKTFFETNDVFGNVPTSPNLWGVLRGRFWGALPPTGVENQFLGICFWTLFLVLKRPLGNLDPDVMLLITWSQHQIEETQCHDGLQLYFT